ncbi:MAG: hypothetical protein A2X22_07030 [Bacteroidetes bacterium GWF2_49_14]|nr:MAG: hypothetical protein A2X22_07030 [Bacteroidetes bacterium GWF2_49_14]HBB91121.1 hypothetical protein [Bacteroidales bacterium]
MKRLTLISSLTLAILIHPSCQKEIVPFNPDIQYGTVVDIDKNVYKTVSIGEQVWMAENLKTTTYSDGTSILNGGKSSEWSGQSGSYCWYDNKAGAYKNPYGALYNWSAVTTGKLCPSGWHVPTVEEWKELEQYLITSGYNFDESTVENKLAKSVASAVSWESDTTSGAPGNDILSNNSTGFSALPAGYRDPTHGWNEYNGMGSSCGWWTATGPGGSFALHSALNKAYPFLLIDDIHQTLGLIGSYGFSVRCVRDE